MRRIAASAAVTLALTGSILFGDLCRIPGQVVPSLFGAGGHAAQVERVYENSQTQEVSLGEDPHRGLQELNRRWRETKPERRVVVIGNSQTYTVILARGETPPSSAPKMYVDRIAERLSSDAHTAVYRLAAPNLSYSEALWYVTYLTSAFALEPSDIVLQLNYESFRKTGIRDGMLSLLVDTTFARVAKERAGSTSSYGAVFGQAIKRYEEQGHKAKRLGDTKGEQRSGNTPHFGVKMEARVRHVLSSTGLEAKNHEAKRGLLQLIYLLRVYLLRITPSTPRPLGGVAYEASVSALDGIAETCRRKGVNLALFLAPQNPAARLWRTEADRELYRSAAEALARRYGLKLVDRENSIDADNWGVWIDGPDPIHFGLRGHVQMAEALISAKLFD